MARASESFDHDGQLQTNQEEHESVEQEGEGGPDVGGLDVRAGGQEIVGAVGEEESAGDDGEDTRGIQAFSGQI